MRILLVEDDAVLRDVMQRSLRDLGNLVDTAETLDSANYLWGVQPFDAVVLDLNLPDGNGLAALRAKCPGLKGAKAQDGAGETTLVLPLESPDGIDELLDLVRARGGRIRELRPRASLEDVFLDLMEAPVTPAATPAQQPAASAPAGAAP